MQITRANISARATQMDNFKDLIWLKSKWFVYLNECVLYISLYSPDNHVLVFHNDQNKSLKRVKSVLKLAPVRSISSMWKWARWARTHPGRAADLSATSPNIPPPSSASILSPATTSDQSIDPRTSRSVGTLWSGPGQLLEWVIVISSCLDQLGLIQAERLWTGARGTADYSHQRQICETIRGLLGFSKLIVLS